jgi:hypothetical protein|nr:MAG TPA: hypothetical protein [Caudoviricetes sp.]
MNKDAHVIAISHEKLSSMTEGELRTTMQVELAKIEAEYNCRKKAIIDDYDPYIKSSKERFNKQKMLKELIEEMSIDDVKLILNVKGYALLTRSESEAIIDYVGIKSMLGEVFK